MIVIGIYEYLNEFVTGVYIVTKVKVGFETSHVHVFAGIVLKK